MFSSELSKKPNKVLVTLTVHVVEGALFITVSCLHLGTNSTAFTH